MTAGRLIGRSLAYFRAAHAALLAGMILVTAVLTGALIMGDSVRDSLRDLSTRRRGEFEKVVLAPGFFSQGLAQRARDRYAAGLTLPGRARSEMKGLTAGVQLLALEKGPEVTKGCAWLTRTAAQTLGVAVGDAVLITLPSPAESGEAVWAKRDRTSLGSLRVKVERILDERGTAQPESFYAWFDLHPTQRPPANVWLALGDLQAALQAEIPAENRIPAQPANMLLVRPGRAGSSVVTTLPQEYPPAASMKLEDYGLGWTPAGNEMILHSGSVYIAPAIARALHPWKDRGLEVYTLLLDKVLPDNASSTGLDYVIATGITGGAGAGGDLGLKDGEVAVNQWAAEQLHVSVGEALHVVPYRVEGDAVVKGPTADFTVAKILPLSGMGADPTLTPTFHGLTDADTMANWSPPAGFPFDRSRVTAADEAYWDAHKAAPKLFFNVLTAQRLVKPRTPLVGNDSGGELTSLRVPTAAAADLEAGILRELTPAAAGFVTLPFAPAQSASTDFAGLFLGLSGFLLIAALLLVVLLFRLAVEQRARQMGLLGALGFTPRRIGRLILAEGALVAVAGMLVGLPVAVWYTRMLVRGLGTWWVGATGTTAIVLHVHAGTVALGGAVSLAAAVLALWWTARRMARGMPVTQLSGGGGGIQTTTRRRGNAKWMLGILLGALVVALLPVALSGAGVIAAPMGFMLTGFLLLTLGIVVLARLPEASRRVRHTLVGIAAAGIFRQRTRAVLCVALMAAAAFLLTSVTAFVAAPTSPTTPPSPTGGYQLLVTTRIPLPADLQTPAGRKLLGLADDPALKGAEFTALKVQPGDDISCLNMTKPTTATLVGVPKAVWDRLEVAKQGKVAGEAIPAAVDQQTAEYILHAGLGEKLPAGNVRRPVVIERLLTDSIFQSYALIREEDFRQAFPDVTRSALYLVDCPPESVAPLRQLLRTALDDFGVTVETTTERLAAYHAVANSYIAAFQFLGALGLLVGALGLVVVLARNVIQRRAELALLQALGFTHGKVTLMLVIEHGLLLALGLALGLATALLATLPQIRQVHVLPVAAALLVILAMGLFVLTIMAHLAMRRLSPAALRQE